MSDLLHDPARLDALRRSVHAELTTALAQTRVALGGHITRAAA